MDTKITEKKVTKISSNLAKTKKPKKKQVIRIRIKRTLAEVRVLTKLLASLLRRYRLSGGMPLLTKAVFLLSTRYKKSNPFNFFIFAINEVTPSYGLSTYLHKGRTYQVPTLISKKKANFLALRWIMSDVALKNLKHVVKNKTIPDSLASTLVEIVDQPKSSLPRKLLKEHYQLVKANIKNIKYTFGKKKKSDNS